MKRRVLQPITKSRTVTRSKSRRYRLKVLLKDCRRVQQHGEVDFGPDVGKEVIK